MNEVELLDLISQGEGLCLEFKQSFPKNGSDLAKELVAFANSQGGILLMGVSDDSQVLGMAPPVDDVKRRLASFARDVCRPPINPEIGHTDVQGKTVVWIKVRKEKIPRSSDDKYYIRVGTIVKVAYIDELIEMVQQSDNTLEKKSLYSIVLVAEEVLVRTNEIVKENQDIMASALYMKPNRERLARRVYQLFHNQEHRADYGKWESFLQEKSKYVYDVSIRGEASRANSRLIYGWA